MTTPPGHFIDDPKCRYCGSYNLTERSGDIEETDETVYWLHCLDCGKDE